MKRRIQPLLTAPILMAPLLAPPPAPLAGPMAGLTAIHKIRLLGAINSAMAPRPTAPNQLASIQMDRRRPLLSHMGYTSTTTEPASALATGNGTARPLVAAEDRYAQVAGVGRAFTDGSQPNGSGDALVRRQNASLASTMTVGGRMPGRSNLLPRNNVADVELIQEEIRELMTTIATKLPPGHEAVERSRHLLQKAQSILQSDPARSAEVEYYLQQVRRIVQRTRQTAAWSNVYRSRLLVYLGGWVLLGLLVVTGVIFLQGELLLDFVLSLGLSVSEPMLLNMLLVATAGFVCALGTALSVLLQMQRHARQEHAYFDRKFGLRGLLLPLIGVLMGVALALVWVAIFSVVAIDPAVTAWAAWALLLLAGLAGLGQPWLYGAR